MAKEFKEYYIGWIDMLGYSDIMLCDELYAEKKIDIKLYEFYKKKKQELEKFQLELIGGKEELYKKLSQEEKGEMRPGRILLSDTIIYYHEAVTEDSGEDSCLKKISIMHYMMNRFVQFLSCGILSRGVITQGRCCIGEGNGIGEGLVKAYQLEKNAKLSRVIIANEWVTPSLTSNFRYKLAFPTNIVEIIGNDKYLDPFARDIGDSLDDKVTTLKECLSYIKVNIDLHQNGDSTVLGKWAYLREYVQRHLAETEARLSSKLRS